MTPSILNTRIEVAKCALRPLEIMYEHYSDGTALEIMCDHYFDGTAIEIIYNIYNI